MSSLQLDFYNCPEAHTFDPARLPKEVPAFIDYEPNFDVISKAMMSYGRYRHLVIVGHGGSISTFYGLYYLWELQSGKKVHFVNTVDPLYLEELCKTLPKDETLVIAISKSGETVTQLEALLQFTDYSLLVIAGKGTPLWQVGERVGAELIEHPAIGGRYTGLTEVALVPAALCGFDVRGLVLGARTLYAKYGEDNSAWRAASIFAQLEEWGIMDVFMPMYGYYLFGMEFSIVQLCHESFGKDGKGQTYFAHTAPESQHHTNQRFFGGRKNIAGWFLHAEQDSTVAVKVPTTLADISFKDGNLGALHNLVLSNSLQFEREGTLEHAQQAGIPVVDMTLRSTDAETIGEFLAFWQLYAVYSSTLRGVDPFNQPEVEESKKISWEKRVNGMES